VKPVFDIFVKFRDDKADNDPIHIITVHDFDELVRAIVGLLKWPVGAAIESIEIYPTVEEAE